MSHGVHESMRVRVHTGADVNLRSPAYPGGTGEVECFLHSLFLEACFSLARVVLHSPLSCACMIGFVPFLGVLVN